MYYHDHCNQTWPDKLNMLQPRRILRSPANYWNFLQEDNTLIQLIECKFCE